MSFAPIWIKRGLKAAIFPGRPYSRDPVSGFMLPSTGSQRPIVAYGERALWFTGTGLELNVTGIGGVIPTPGSSYPWSATVRYTRTPTATVWSRASSPSSTSRMLQVYHDSATYQPGVYWKGGLNPLEWWGSGTDLHTLTLTWDGVTGRAYGDDDREASLTLGTATENIIIRLGSRTSTTGFAANGAAISAFLLFDRAITRSAHINLHHDLQRLLAPNLAKYKGYQFGAAAAGGTPTITALSARLITATSAQPRISYS